uniref:Uncharacterized protein n=1 Tax=Nelumbo nucifera TaxID=4432 RepID=A0A822ZX68_NELNU|nr:TPA_asm: hypothetical protein HUJ06_017756 [Nelumbo nucifera]
MDKLEIKLIGAPALQFLLPSFYWVGPIVLCLVLLTHQYGKESPILDYKIRYRSDVDCGLCKWAS